MDFKINKFKTLDSTSKYLFDFISENESQEGLIIVANNQPNGKGNGDNKWESEEDKNLTFSLLLKPDFIDAEDQFSITQIISLSLLNALSKYLDSNSLRVKWPNDIYFSDKKLGGILIQNTIKGSKISNSVVGIGINVNQEKFISTAPNPVSIIQITNETVDRESLLKEILNDINDYYSRLMLFPSNSWLEKQYLEKLFQINELCSYKDKTGVFEGEIKGIDNFGRLIIEKKGGKQEKYGFKEVEFIF
ncbi:MAG: biotin--[acetyl-CoA-carboxylase] ligase [Marinilabiliales bacterium]|nr:MAG: biotin--[acetyl-CoA-carboxylase] ligase [Marinilabiliales bacterium]